MPRGPRFGDALRALLDGEPYSADTVDQALNQATDGCFADLAADPDFGELFGLAKDYHVHDRAALALQPRPPGHELVAYRGAGESAGGALVAAATPLGAGARDHVIATRRSLTEACLAASEGAPERAEMLAWLAGFHAALDGEVRPVG